MSSRLSDQPLLTRFALFAVFAPCAAYAAQGAPVSFIAHYIGLRASDSAQAVALDTQGNSFVVSRVVRHTGAVLLRASKLNPAGAVIASFEFGGTGQDYPAAISVDPLGNVLIVGTTSSSDFPANFNLGSTGASSKYSAAFIVKLDSGLTGIISSAILGGSPSSRFSFGTSAAALVVDKAGNIYVAGSTDERNFPVTAGAFQTAPPATQASGGWATFAYLAKVAPDLSRISYAAYFGSDHPACPLVSLGCPMYPSTGITAVALDALGDPVIAGTTTSDMLPVTPGVFAPACQCSFEASFSAKVASDGSRLVWSTYLTQEFGASNSLALDTRGNVVIAGNSVHNGIASGLVLALDSTGSSLVFTRNMGQNPPGPAAVAKGVTIDTAGTIWVTGTALTLTDVSSGPIGPTYVASLSPDGTQIESFYSALLGAAAQGIATGSNGVVSALGAAGSLLLSTPGPVSVTGITNAAASSVSGGVAPNEIISVYGYGLGPSPPLDITGGTGAYRLLFSGIPALLLSAGPYQVTAVVPAGITTSDTAQVQWVTPQATTDLMVLRVAASRPEIFHYAPGPGIGTTPYAMAVNQDGTLNSPGNPAPGGSIVSIWATGTGLTGAQRLPISVQLVTAGSANSLEVLYAGESPGQVSGLTQINFRVPSAPLGIQVQLQAGPAISAPVLVATSP